MTLRTRVFAGLLLIAVILGVTAVLVTRNTESHLVGQLDAQLASADQSLHSLNEGRPPHQWPDEGFDQPARPNSFFVGWIDADGELQTESAPNLGGAQGPTPVIDAATAQAGVSTGDPFTTSSTYSGVRYRALASYEHDSGVVSIVALPMSDVDDAVNRLVMVETVATAVALGALAIVAWWVVHLGVRPIKRMTASASAIASGGLSSRVPEADVRTEAGELSVALNQMLARIEDAFAEREHATARLRQFVADASHELRTPVTTIRGYAELYRSGGLERRDDLVEAMRRTEQEAVRMSELVDDMLQLARLDQGRPLELAPVDLATLARDAVRDARAVDPGRPIACDDSGPVIVLGDEHRLRQVLANLVGNALVHTPESSPIEVRLGTADGLAVIEVVDHGPGMTPAVASRVFERFFRADPSRSRHRGGSGLGLAIVEGAVAAHGGTVVLRSVPGVGTTARVELPTAPRDRILPGSLALASNRS